MDGIKLAQIILIELLGEKDGFKQYFKPPRYMMDFPSIDDLARKYEVSPQTIRRRFSSGPYGSYIKFKRQARVELAKQLLSDGLSVGDVSILCGYSDKSGLIREFNKMFGMTPRQYMYAIGN